MNTKLRQERATLKNDSIPVEFTLGSDKDCVCILSYHRSERRSAGCHMKESTVGKGTVELEPRSQEGLPRASMQSPTPRF